MRHRWAAQTHTSGAGSPANAADSRAQSTPALQPWTVCPYASNLAGMTEPEQEARDALIDWRAAHVQTHLENVPEGLWHYTDAAGLRGILDSEGIWASDGRFLNDATELNYGLELAHQAVDTAAQSGRWTKSTSRFLQRVMASDGANLTGFLRARAEVYVACLCANGDLLSQWRAYAGRDTAGGYALQLRHRAPLTGWIDHLGRARLRLQKVVYNRDDQLALITDLIERVAPVYDRQPSERAMDALAKTLADGIIEFATSCKHPSFEEESEWRVVYERSSDPHPLEVQHRVSHGLFVPYVVLTLPAAVGSMTGHLPITEIRCGPAPDPALKKDGVQRMLRSFDAYEQVTVSGSDSPLRL